jgi:hypothetical protein
MCTSFAGNDGLLILIHPEEFCKILGYNIAKNLFQRNRNKIKKKITVFIKSMYLHLDTYTHKKKIVKKKNIYAKRA